MDGWWFILLRTYCFGEYDMSTDGFFLLFFWLYRYPVYSFFLPVYSFWCMDEFSWGNTRVVVGEGKEKKVLMSEEEKFDEKFSGAFSFYFCVFLTL